ncbi:recombination protein RecR [Bacteroidaceae bacterium]|uniref:recombination mediator RecR n=1 Tax=Prevotella sp. MGM2 TaxID=2033406 RepID=UPI000CEA23A2|nr:recombination mediator RecR [Prevotella sp. MGM2]GAY29962.1 recombination protein RecR [Prevotella sp. MGM2]GFI34847.1 recombination protein RecR [Bacteroidaceae bacterium]
MQIEQYPSRLLEKAITEMSKLPGIGRRTALRLVLHLLQQDSQSVHELAGSLVRLRDEVKYCSVCHNISDTDVCDICANPLRDRSVVCVVENVRGVLSIENTGQFRGLYHVLGGVISPVDGVGPADLELDSLIGRVKEGGVEELILALNPTMEGDTTNFYIQRRLEGIPVKLSVLARGVSVGDELEFTDEVTLGRSIADRKSMN